MKKIKINFYQKVFILVYLCISLIYFENKQIIIKHHAIRRAKERNIVFPEQVYSALRTGKVQRFAKNGIKFVKKTNKDSIICLGEETDNIIIIKTIMRGN